jgi:drug/metabolite transporter (DMT)-like permease
MTAADLAPVLFGLASAATWGAGDFCGGLASRRSSAIGVVIFGDLVGAVLLAGLALLLGEALPPLTALVWGALAGLAGAAGLLALYRSLALGRMSIASPLTAIFAGLFPVLFGLLTEGLPSVFQFAGFALALFGVWCLASTGRLDFHWRDLGLPLISGFGFGLFFILIGQAARTAAIWPLVASRAAGTLGLMAYALATRQFALPAREHWPLTTLVGVLDAAGNGFFAFAARLGRLDVASVLASLYPASTVWLAWVFLKERLTRQQLVGVLAALAAVVLIAV